MLATGAAMARSDHISHSLGAAVPYHLAVPVEKTLEAHSAGDGGGGLVGGGRCTPDNACQRNRTLAFRRPGAIRRVFAVPDGISKTR